MMVFHEGRPVSLQGSTTFYEFDWALYRYETTAKMRERMDDMLRTGVLADNNGKPFPEPVQSQLRRHLLHEIPAAYGDKPERFGFREASPVRRSLIPGLWPWGTHPMLGGNKGAGKSSAVIDLAASLAQPGRRFLDYFEPADLTEQERERGILLINAEVNPDDYEGEMVRQGIRPGVDPISVVHLSAGDYGGPRSFDLTVPESMELWEHLLVFCIECRDDGYQAAAPVVIIVDGLTAILDSDTRRYGAWSSRFVELMRVVDCPNSLVTVHNTLAGDHPMQGVESTGLADGVWRYSSDNPDRFGSARRFGVPTPRIGGVGMPDQIVVLGEDGRLRLDHASVAGGGPSTPVNEEEQVGDRLAAYVADHPGADGQELTDYADCEKVLALAGRSNAVTRNLIREEKCRPDCPVCRVRKVKHHHRRRHYYAVAESVPSTTDD